MPNDDLVLVDEPAPAVRRLTLNRPGKRNALSNALRRRLFEELDAGDADPSVSVMVVRGAGSCFSAGYDLAQDPSEGLPGHAARADGFWPRHVVEGWFHIWDLATPVIAQVHGFCLAGGTELATACDLVYVADDAQVGYPPVRLMSPPDMTWQPWLLGLRRGMHAVLTGDPMTGAEAAQSGFANLAVPAGELDATVLGVATRIAKVPFELLAINKRTVHRAMEVMGIRTGIRATTELQALAFHQQPSRDYRATLADGLTAALQRRDAPFADYRTATDSGPVTPPDPS